MGQWLDTPTTFLPPPPVGLSTSAKPRRRGRRILVAVGIVMLLLAAAAGAGYLVFSPQIGALLAARAFCQEVEQHQYTAAYSDFTPDLQQRVPRAAFVTISTRGDALEGPVIGCSLSGVDVTSDRQNVVINSVVTRSLQGQTHQDLDLTLLGGHWKIAQPPDPLLLPLTTAYLFCTDLEQQNYTAAFGLLTIQTQAKVGNSLLFQGIFTASHFVTGNLKDCQVASATFSANQQQVLVASTLVFQHFPSLTSQVVLSQDTPGAWAVQRLALTVLGFSVDVPPGS